MGPNARLVRPQVLVEHVSTTQVFRKFHRIMAPKIVDREQRHREILTAAFELFVEKGYHKTTLGEIARSVGIGQGTLYYYFPTKDEIFWGVYNLMMSHVEEGFRHRLEAVNDPIERLEEFFKLLFLNFPEVGVFETPQEESEGGMQWDQMVGFSHVLMEFWLQAERSGKQEQFYERIGQHQRSIVQDVQTMFSVMDIAEPEGLDHELMAHLLLALHNGLSIQLRMGVMPKDTTILKRILNLFLRRIRPECSATSTNSTNQAQEA
ncbi:MAG: TetR/AcrR family transcriptional regulator [Deltaproteobacteria bacterium]|nr:MAG: TetR/AcrR family transcriptional regulator [Deltaproteobacteria bacterium]